jgi:hypothetical protein
MRFSFPYAIDGEERDNNGEEARERRVETWGFSEPALAQSMLAVIERTGMSLPPVWPSQGRLSHLRARKRRGYSAGINPGTV